MKNKMFILMLNALLISLFSWNVFSQDTDPRIGLYYRLSPKDDTVSIDVFIQSASNVAGCQVWLTYNPAVLDYVDEVFEEGDYFPANAFYGQRQLESLSDTETRLRFAVASSPIENKNNGIIATLTFKVLNAEENLSLSLVDGDLNKGTGTLFSDATGSLLLPSVVEPDDDSNIQAVAKSLLEELIGLDDPFAAVAGVAPPYDKLDAADVANLRANWDDIARGAAGHSERLDANKNGSVNERDLKLVEFALKLDLTEDGILNQEDAEAMAEAFQFVGPVGPKYDIDGDGSPRTLEDQSIVFRAVQHIDPSGSTTQTSGTPDLVVESIRASHTVLSPGEEFSLHVTVINKGASTSDTTKVIYYRSINDTISSTDERIRTGGTVSLAGEDEFRRKLPLNAPDNPGTYYYGACVDTVTNEIETGNNCSKAFKVTVTGIGLEIPKNLISEVAFGEGSTYFVLNHKFPTVTRFSKAQGNPADPGNVVPEVSPIDRSSITFKECIVTIDLPNAPDQPVSEVEALPDIPPYFSYSLLTPEQRIHNIEPDISIKNFIAAVSPIFSTAGSYVGGSIGALVGPKGAIVGAWVGKAAGHLTFRTAKNAWNLKDKNAKEREILLSTADPVFVYSPFIPEDGSLVSYIWGGIQSLVDLVVGHKDLVDADRYLFMVTKQIGTVGITVEQIYSMNGQDEVAIYKGSLSLAEIWRNHKQPSFSAPHAQPMSLADYPPFQQLPPEVQEYLLQYFEGAANPKAINAEMWQVPADTALLPNYPNPFNPETWIPYQLATPADVTLTIYDIQGRVVRELDLGHQRAGMYHSRSRAAYWDGKNAEGESVASGVYFYTLSTQSTRDSVTAGDFSATRKMLIRK